MNILVLPSRNIFLVICVLLKGLFRLWLSWSWSTIKTNCNDIHRCWSHKHCSAFSSRRQLAKWECYLVWRWTQNAQVCVRTQNTLIVTWAESELSSFSGYSLPEKIRNQIKRCWRSAGQTASHRQHETAGQRPSEKTFQAVLKAQAIFAQPERVFLNVYFVGAWIWPLLTVDAFSTRNFADEQNCYDRPCI